MPLPTPARRRVIKKVAGHGHHGGAWKIAYADFVTAMMALFMVLWLLATTDPKSRKEISQYFRTGIMPDAEMAMNGGAQQVPPIMEERPTPPPPGHQSIAAEKLKQQIQQVAENHVDLAKIADRVRVVETEDGILIEIADKNDDLLFDTASSELKPPLEEFLAVLSPVLAKRSEPIEIQGHTDAHPFAAGIDKTNWDLSYERAAAARGILEANGVAPDRIVGVIGRASALPIDKDPYAAKNRRLSILLRDKRPAVGSVDDTAKPVIDPI